MEDEKDTPQPPEETNDSPNEYAVAMAAKEAARIANRPVIDDLPDAVTRDAMGRLVLLARPGDKLVVERFATVLPGKPWLDTKTYTVHSIDEATGRVHLWDDELQRVALTDYIGGTKVGYRFKLPIKGRPVVASKKKRGRPRKIQPITTPADTSTTATETSKRRGRPKGSKNRSKEEIRTEKTLKAAKKRARKTKP
jgi:hypothetical protein